ncbi:MAG: DUF4401 domain-containing protein [Dongiaceae bacterium]
MTTLAAFCTRIGIDEGAARQALTARTSPDDAPWYMQTVLGIGAWVTAIASLFFFWAIMDLVLGIDEPDLVVAIIGTIVFAASLWLLHRRPEGAFSAHVAVAFATAGTLLAAAGIGGPQQSPWIAAVATLPFTAAAIWQQRSPLLQFLIVSVALILGIVAIWDRWDNLVADLAAITIPFGALLLLYPPRRDVRPAAFALLVLPPIMEVVALNFGAEWSFWYGWPAKAVFLALCGFLFFVNWRRLPNLRGRTLALAGVAAVVAAAILLPTGASAALTLLLLAYALGSRTLALIGALMETYFIWRLYEDVHSTLLTKSIILMSTGGVLLACYFLLAVATRRRPS